MIKNNGGQTGVDSVLAKGSTFWFTFINDSGLIKECKVSAMDHDQVAYERKPWRDFPNLLGGDFVVLKGRAVALR
jgi:hypothetical protein